jgi:hypothetical protein
LRVFPFLAWIWDKGVIRSRPDVSIVVEDAGDADVHPFLGGVSTV